MSLKVLLVEDEGAQALALRQALEGLGHQVLAVASEGSQACRLCRELAPELVLMDIGLPGMDGLEAARVMNLERPLPVVLVTGQASRRFQERARQALVYSYLLKPVEAKVLGEAMELAVRNFAQERELKRQVTDLRQELRARKLVERARGLLMDRHRLSAEEAQVRLEREAEVRGLDLPAAAQALLTAGPTPPTARPR